MICSIDHCRTAAGIAIVAVLLLLTACADSKQNGTAGPSERPPQVVLTQEVVYGRESVMVEAVGTSRALHSVSLRSRVEGEVTEVLFSAGDFVEAGQVLLKLDDRDERLAVELAQVELEEAQRRLNRYRASIDSGGVTRSDLDDAVSAVKRAQITLQRAQVDLDYHTIKAPFAGHVGMSDLDPGAWVGANTVITTLDDRSTLLVRFSLPEMLLGKLSIGDLIALSTWTDSSAVAEGEVVDLDSRVDEAQRTFQLRAHVINDDDLLRPGMSFRIRLTLEGGRYPQVPEISLQWGGEGAFVWIVEQDKVKRLPVNLVQRQDQGVLVEGNLPEGAPVVTEGVHIVREGMAVRVLNAGADKAGTFELGAAL